MANSKHLRILSKGVEEWNLWRRNKWETKPDLGGADLSRAYLMRANLSDANLSKADLSNADLSKADLREADLSNANLSNTKLSDADLSRANLTGAKFTKAELYDTNLTGANLRGTDLSGACLLGTNLTSASLIGVNFSHVGLGSSVFAATEFCEVIGLDTVSHFLHSSIGIDTFFHSKGTIPEVFLRGAGVPDIFIEYAASLVGKRIEFYSTFISYSHHDHPLAERLHADLQAKGVRCWFAPEDLKIGDRFRTEIDRAIRLHDKLLLLLSAASVASDWVEKEVESAFERERRDKQTILFPIRLDNAVMDVAYGWAADIRRTRHIGDFTNWKDHDAYENGFARLLRDLKAAAKA